MRNRSALFLAGVKDRAILSECGRESALAAKTMNHGSRRSIGRRALRRDRPDIGETGRLEHAFDGGHVRTPPVRRIAVQFTPWIEGSRGTSKSRSEERRVGKE